MEASSGRTLTEMVTQVPGVTSLASGPTISKPMIHGLYGNRILILNQGIRQEDQQWGNEHAPSLDPFTSDRVTVVKGAASVQYGADALGGVIITEPVELPHEAGMSGEIRAVGILNGRGGGANGMLQGGLKGVPGFGWRVQGSGRHLGDSFAPDYLLSNTGLRESGISGSAGWQSRRFEAEVYYSWFDRGMGILKASHIGNLTDLQKAIDSGKPWFEGPWTDSIGAPSQTIRHDLLRAETSYRVTDRDQLLLTYGYQANSRQEYDVRRGGRTNIPALDLFLLTHTADLVLKHFIGKSIHGRLGVSGVYQENYNIPGTGIRPLIPDYTSETLGIFLLEHFPVGKNLELEVGARSEFSDLRVRRYDFNDVYRTPEHQFRNYALSGGADWTVRDSLHFRANISSAYRPPNVSELYSEGLHHGTATIEIGDDGLGSENSWKATAELEGYWMSGRLYASLTLYSDHIDSYIYLRPNGYELTIRGAFPVFQYVATDAWLHGADVTIEYRINSSWSLRDRSSIVRGRDLHRDEWLFSMPTDRTENSLLYHLPVWGGWKQLELAATSTYILRQDRIPVGLDFAEPPGSYHLIGISASIVRPLRKGELRFGVEGANLFNVAYRDYLDRFRYYADARGIDLTCWARYSFGK
ncbi:MAG: TonB-dependent receptor [Flavobacteriales bacterium]|nr:TonB-dependent receptor [Flavobacteriales bacterium]